MSATRKSNGLFATLLLLTITGSAYAKGGDSGDAGAPSQEPGNPMPMFGPRPSPDNAPPADYGPLAGYFAAKDQLKNDTGLVPTLGVDLTTQSVVNGPNTFTSWVWRYDLGIVENFSPDTQMNMDVRGGLGPDAGQIIGSTENTDQYANTGSEAFVLHLWFAHEFFDGQFTLRGGKMDVGDFIDVNRFGYYNFLGFSQNHNPAIPFPNNPLAGMFTISPKSIPFYLSGGVSNAAQSGFQEGFSNLVRGGNHIAAFAIAELGYMPKIAGQPGIYRFQYWYSDLDQQPIGGGPIDGGRWGVGLDFDQSITANLGLFARYAWGEQNEFTPRGFWQLGFDWKGIIPGRPKDDLALAVAQSTFSSQRNAITPDARASEDYIEGYYNYVVYDWFQIQPFVQVLNNTGGRDAGPNWILSMHLAFRF
jgi:carbohydrate-selective porin OprB